MSGGTADGHFPHPLQNGLTAQLLIVDNTVNVRQLGAKGDGEADDTAPINAATKSGVKHVYLPAGTYMVNPIPTDYEAWTSQDQYKNRKACIYLNSGIATLYGDDWDKSIIRLFPQTEKYYAVICAMGALNGFTMHRLGIDQNIENCPIAPDVGSGAQAEYDAGYYRNNYKLYCLAGTLNDSEITMCSFKHMGSNAIYVRSGKCIVNNCRFLFDMSRSEDIDYTYSNVAYDNSCLFLCGDYVRAEHNEIDSALAPGEVYITGTKDGNVITAMATARGAVETHAVHAWTEHNTINNYSTGINLSGMTEYGSGYATASFSRNHVTNAACVVNLCGDDQKRQNNPDAALEWGGLRRITVAGNDIHISFRHHSTHPGAVGFAGAASGEDVYIYDNTIRYDRATFEADYPYNMVMSAAISTVSWRARNIHIYNNTVVDAPIYGVEISRTMPGYSARGVYVHDNTLIGCGWCTAINKADTLEGAGRLYWMRAAITVPQESSTLGNTLDEIHIEDNTIIDNSEHGECGWAIQCNKATVDQRKVIVRGNREISVSGAGFARETYADITGQPYGQVPALSHVTECPSAGTYYAGQTYVNTGDNAGVARWKCVSCGTIGKTLGAAYQTGTVDTSKSLNLITMADEGHGIQSGDKLLVTIGGAQKPIHVYIVNGAKLYVTDLVSSGTVVTGSVGIAYQDTAAFEPVTISSGGSGDAFVGDFDIPGTIPAGVQKISMYTVSGATMVTDGTLTHASGTMTAGEDNITLPALGEWDSLTGQSGGAGIVTRQTSGIVYLKNFSWFYSSAQTNTAETCIGFGTNTTIPLAEPPADDKGSVEGVLLCSHLAATSVNGIGGKSTENTGIACKNTGAIRLRISKADMLAAGCTEDEIKTEAGMLKWATATNAAIVYKIAATTEQVTLTPLTAVSGVVTLTGGYSGGTMTAVEDTEKSWTLLADITPEVDTASFTMTADAAGNSFDCQEILLVSDSASALNAWTALIAGAVSNPTIISTPMYAKWYKAVTESKPLVIYVQRVANVNMIYAGGQDQTANIYYTAPDVDRYTALTIYFQGVWKAGFNLKVYGR